MSALKRALIIGASRGLGLGLVQRLKEDGWAVTATVRDTGKAEALRAVSGIQIEQLDMDDAQSVDALHTRLHDQVFDLLFVNAGVKLPCQPDARCRPRARSCTTVPDQQRGPHQPGTTLHPQPAPRHWRAGVHELRSWQHHQPGRA